MSAANKRAHPRLHAAALQAHRPNHKDPRHDRYHQLASRRCCAAAGAAQLVIDEPEHEED
jgi:hypothetical protein